MYTLPGRPWPTLAESVADAEFAACSFLYGAEPGHGTEKERAAEMYDLARFFWYIAHRIANTPEPLDSGQRLRLAGLIDRCEEAFMHRFPTLVPAPRARDGFDALRHFVAVAPAQGCAPTRLFAGSRKKAWARADWMRNTLHNIYLEAWHLPPLPARERDAEKV